MMLLICVFISTISPITSGSISQLMYMQESALMEAVSQGSPESWIWQAGLKRPEKRTLFCGGVLVSNSWVLTSAHCVYQMKDMTPTPAIEVIIGEKDLRNRDGVATNVSEVFIYPGYDPQTEDFDFALLRLPEPIEGSPYTYIRPVALPPKDLDFESGTFCFVSGYGFTKPGSNASAKLMIIQVPIAPDKDCNEAYKDHKITPHMFCAGFAEGGVDACQGDGGGPLVCKDEATWYLKGIVSWGRGCGVPGSFGVYADVKSVMDWIEQLTREVVESNVEETAEPEPEAEPEQTGLKREPGKPKSSSPVTSKNDAKPRSIHFLTKRVVL